MKFCLNVISISLIFLTPIFAQHKWEKVVGGSGRDQAFSVQQTQDGGYIVAGFTGSFGHGCYDAYVVKKDARGDTVWTKTYGTRNNDYSWSIALCGDGGYALLGATDSIFQTGPHDLYLVRISSAGNLLWTQVYGDTSKADSCDESGFDVQETTDGGYILVGGTRSFGAGAYDVYLVKTDSVGDTLWTKTYGTPMSESGRSVQQTQDGGYIIAGSAYVSGTGYDVYLVRTDSQGDTLWTRTYGGADSDNAQCVVQTQDEGFVFAGATGGDLYLGKTDSAGNLLWTKVYGGMYNDWANAVRKTEDGGFVIVGGTRTSIDPEHCYVWLLKTDSSGDTLWTKIKDAATANGMDVQTTNDGGYIIGAITWEYGGDDDFYLIKTDSTGESSIEESKIRKTMQTRIKTLPNPFICFTTVPGYEDKNFVAYDIAGKMVGRFKGNKIGIDLLPGVYFIVLENMTNTCTRIVKVR